MFTINNYTNEEKDALLNISQDAGVAYLMYGEEVGEQGTPHLQGHLECVRAIRRSTLSSIPALRRAWLQVRKGSFEQAEQYCSKDGAVSRVGERVSRGRGSRSDLDSLRDDLANGRSLREISNDHFASFLRYRRSINSYRALHATPRNWKVSVVVYWGGTGLGKTSAVYENAPEGSVFTYPGSGWFDGYDQEPIVLFDDFSGAEFKLPYLLKLLDRYPMRVPIKGDFVNWAPREVYLTSNLDPRDWFPRAHAEHVAALFRRITNIVHFV
jgi:hypothetical protein